MKLRIVSLVVLMLALFTASASAQTSGGVKGGIGFASISAEDEDVEEYLFIADSRTGFLIGGFVDVPVSDMFTFVIEGLYSQKGAKGTLSEQGFRANTTVKVDYIEIPILAKFPFNRTARVHPFVYGGVAPAFKVSAEALVDFAGEEAVEDIDDGVESVDLGLVFGGGVRFGLFAVEARYNFGLMNINTDPSIAEGSLNNRHIAILGSFYFR